VPYPISSFAGLFFGRIDAGELEDGFQITPIALFCACEGGLEFGPEIFLSPLRGLTGGPLKPSFGLSGVCSTKCGQAGLLCQRRRLSDNGRDSGQEGERADP